MFKTLCTTLNPNKSSLRALDNKPLFPPNPYLQQVSGGLTVNLTAPSPPQLSIRIQAKPTPTIKRHCFLVNRKCHTNMSFCEEMSMWKEKKPVLQSGIKGKMLEEAEPLKE